MSYHVAVFIDGDNISNQHVNAIIGTAKLFGEVSFIRVYVDANKRSGWLSTVGVRVMHAGVGKNAADILLALDALELLLKRDVKRFVVASSDGDFTHLATRLRERGASVVGMGEGKAPDSFRACCSEFVELDAGRPCQQPQKTGQSVSKFDQQIRSMIAQNSSGEAGMPITDLAPRMHRIHGVRIRQSPERSWRAYLLKRPALYDLDPRGPDAMVRILPDGFARASQC